MADKTGIEWADATWNPTVGCSLVSPGCTNCYAMRAAWRLHHAEKYAGLTELAGARPRPVWTGVVRLDEAALDIPLRWRRPRRIFVNSISDLFHESLPDVAIDRVFAVMALAPQHTFLVLTKRAARMREYIDMAASRVWRQVGETPDEWRVRRIDGDPVIPCLAAHGARWGGEQPWPLCNVWLGVSVEDQARADERIPDLLATPAAKRFISAEPLLGPIDIAVAMLTDAGLEVLFAKYEAGELRNGRGSLDWVIVGGESGAGARPMHPDWARSLRDQCAAADVPFFFKQWGEWIGADEWFDQLT